MYNFFLHVWWFAVAIQLNNLGDIEFEKRLYLIERKTGLLAESGRVPCHRISYFVQKKFEFCVIAVETGE